MEALHRSEDGFRISTFRSKFWKGFMLFFTPLKAIVNTEPPRAQALIMLLKIALLASKTFYLQ